MSKNIDDINRRTRANNQAARNIRQLCTEGDISIEYKLVEQIKDELAFPPSTTGVIVEYLNRHGWIRTPDEAEAAARGEVPGRTASESNLIKAVGDPAHDEFAAGFFAGFRHGGGQITPDPEPTNAEKLAEIIDGHINPDGITPESLAAYLVAHGVTAPGGDDE